MLLLAHFPVYHKPLHCTPVILGNMVAEEDQEVGVVQRTQQERIEITIQRRKWDGQATL